MFTRLGLVGETGTRRVPIDVFNSQSWCSEPYLSTDRRTIYRPSRIQVYPLHHPTLRTSMSILDKLRWYWYQGQDNGTVAYEDEHDHVAPHGILRSCTSRKVTYFRQLHLPQSTQLTPLPLWRTTSPSCAGNSVVRL